MASCAALPSDPEFLLDLMDNLPDESDSADEFSGSLLAGGSPTQPCTAANSSSTLTPQVQMNNCMIVMTMKV